MLGGVFAGKGRVFKCLQEKIGQTEFGSSCKAQVEERGRSMQEDYRLDFGVSTACQSDVESVCAEEKVAVDADLSCDLSLEEIDHL